MEFMTPRDVNMQHHAPATVDHALNPPSGKLGGVGAAGAAASFFSLEFLSTIALASDPVLSGGEAFSSSL